MHDSDKQREEAERKAEIAFFAIQQNDLNDAFAEVEHIKAILDGGMPEGLPELSLDAIHGGLAMHVQAFYTGVEYVLKNTLENLDGAVPSGTAWHAQLMKQAARPSANREAILSADTFVLFNELRSFRHFIHNVYGTRLDNRRVRNIARTAMTAGDRLGRDWDAFVAARTRAPECQSETNANTESHAKSVRGSIDPPPTATEPARRNRPG